MIACGYGSYTLSRSYNGTEVHITPAISAKTRRAAARSICSSICGCAAISGSMYIYLGVEAVAEFGDHLRGELRRHLHCGVY